MPSRGKSEIRVDICHHCHDRRLQNLFPGGAMFSFLPPTKGCQVLPPWFLRNSFASKLRPHNLFDKCQGWVGVGILWEFPYPCFMHYRRRVSFIFCKFSLKGPEMNTPNIEYRSMFFHILDQPLSCCSVRRESHGEQGAPSEGFSEMALRQFSTVWLPRLLHSSENRTVETDIGTRSNWKLPPPPPKKRQ